MNNKEKSVALHLALCLIVGSVYVYAEWFIQPREYGYSQWVRYHFSDIFCVPYFISCSYILFSVGWFSFSDKDYLPIYSLAPVLAGLIGVEVMTMYTENLPFDWVDMGCYLVGSIVVLILWQVSKHIINKTST